jgi:hypothetical protein
VLLDLKLWWDLHGPPRPVQEPPAKPSALVGIWPGKVPPGERQRHDDDDEFLLLI